jgi:hypothetical protein
VSARGRERGSRDDSDREALLKSRVRITLGFFFSLLLCDLLFLIIHPFTMVSPVAASSSTKPAGEKKDGGWHPRCVLGPFDVKMPPVKRHMVSGHLVPTLRTALFPKKRRVSIEIHAPSAATKSTTTTALPELQPWDPDTGVLNEQDLILVRVFRLSKDRGGSHDEDDGK